MAATTADAVVVEIEARVGGFNSATTDAAAKFDKSMSSVERSATRAEAAITRQTAAAKAGYQQLGFQINDVVAQLASGSNPATVFAQQIGQIIGALQLIGDGSGGGSAAGGASSALGEMSETLDTATGAIESAKAASGQLATALSREVAASETNTAATAANSNARGRATVVTATSTVATQADTRALGANAAASGAATAATSTFAARKAQLLAFLAGPYGAALVGAATLIGVMGSRLLSTGNEVDKLVGKMRDQARQTENNRRADDIWRISIEGVTEAIRKRREEQQKSLETDVQAEQRALANARGELATQRDNLQKAREELTAAREALAAQSTRSRGAGQGAEAAALSLPRFQARVEAAKQKIATLERSVAEAEAAVRGAELPLSEREVSGRIDKAVAATNEYTKALGRLRSERERGLITQKQFEDRLEAETRKRDEAIKKARDAAKTQPTDADLTPFLRPVPGAPNHRFGERRPGRSNHAGVDIPVPVGTRVQAAAAGTVIESGTLPGYGNVVIIDHGRGTITRYAHLSQLGVAKGTAVGAGDTIGLSGGRRGAAGSGNSTGPHLHYEVRRNGKAVNPLQDAFPADQLATTRKAVEDEFDRLLDTLLEDAQRATDQIATEFQSLDDALNPAEAAARQFREQLEVIERARLIGLIDDTKAAETRMLLLAKAMQPVIDMAGAVRSGVQTAGAAIGEEAGGAVVDALDEAKRRAESQIYDLANLYESLFTGGVEGLWDTFKREGLRALAFLAAQQTFRLFSNQSGGGGFGGGLFGGGGLFDITTLFGGGIAGRASGGYVGPHQMVRVNEHKGGVELLRMGAQGGQVIPLGESRAAQPRPSSPVIVHVAVEEGALFRPVVRTISAETARPIAETTAAAAGRAAYKQAVADAPRAVSDARRYSG